MERDEKDMNPIHANIYKTDKKIGTDEKNNAQNDEGI